MSCSRGYNHRHLANIFIFCCYTCHSELSITVPTALIWPSRFTGHYKNNYLSTYLVPQKWWDPKALRKTTQKQNNQRLSYACGCDINIHNAFVGFKGAYFWLRWKDKFVEVFFLRVTELGFLRDLCWESSESGWKKTWVKLHRLTKCFEALQTLYVYGLF